MKLSKIKIFIVSMFTALCIFVSPAVSLKANTQYEIIFKAGLHGNIGGNKSISIMAVAGSLFPDEPVVEAADGYVFKGWNKELPAVGSSVDGKQIYVAQYDVLVTGVNYIVRYINEENVEIATPKASMAEDGSKVVERAKNVAGYAYEKAEQNVTISNKNKTITFTYRLTNPKEVIRYEEEVVNQTINGTNTNNQTNNNNAADGGTGNANTENENEQDNAKDKETVNPNDTPKAKAKGSASNSNTWMMVAGVGVVAIILVTIGFVVLKKRKVTEHS